MERNSFEFKAPQFCDFYSTNETTLQCEENSSPFITTITISPENTEHDLKSSNFSRFLNTPTSENLLELKTGERAISDKRSSVLCERHEENSSYILKQVFTSTFDNVLSNTDREEITTPSKLNIQQNPHKEEAYLFNLKSKLNTPKQSKNDLAQLIKVATGDKPGTPEEKRSYSGLAVTKARNRYTVVCPFSFQERNEIFLRKKQEKLTKAQEEIGKVTEFHARPVPSYILSSNMNKLNINSTQDKAKKTPQKTAIKEERIFKAKFPEVLRKEPFIPIKFEKPATPSQNISLHTERRARERKIIQNKN